MIIGVSTIISYYEYFYQKKYNSPKYRFKPPIKAISKIHLFLESLDDQYDLQTLGKVFLTNYFLFQFNRTNNQVFQRFASRNSVGDIKVGGRIQIYDIIGKQALKYWNERDLKFDFLLQIQNNEFAKQYNIQLDELFILVEKESVSSKSIFRNEEIEKSRFFNTARGLLNCIERTSLYNHYSQKCLLCIHKKDCKDILKKNYLHIYKKRGYGTSSHK